MFFGVWLCSRMWFTKFESFFNLYEDKCSVFLFDRYNYRTLSSPQIIPLGLVVKDLIVQS